MSNGSRSLSEAYLSELCSTLDQIACDLRVVIGDRALFVSESERADLPDERIELLAAARNLALVRRQWGQAFGKFRDIFGDPAFDMLLAIYIGFEGDKVTSVSSACYASGAPMTTALRYVEKLEKRGLIARDEDPFDRRRQLLKLTDLGTDLLESCLRKFELGRRRE